MIQRVQEDGWIRLRRGSIKRTSPRAGCASFSIMAVVMFAGFFLFSSLRIFPLVSFLLLAALMVFCASAIAALQELIWGARVSVSVSRQPTRAGESFRVRYSIGRPGRVDGAAVTWEGREVAIFRAYKDSTFVEPFLVQQLDLAAGATSIEVPEDAMPSFKGKNVRIDWCVSIDTWRGETRTQEDFPVIVLPAR